MGLYSRYISILLSVIALIGQMTLPVVHAQAMARHGGDPMLYAFCGKASAASLAQFRRTAPQELLDRLNADQAKASTPACDLCASVHSNHLATPSAVSLSLSRLAHETVADDVLPSTPAVRLVRLPQLRAPPHFS